MPHRPRYLATTLVLQRVDSKQTSTTWFLVVQRARDLPRGRGRDPRWGRAPGTSESRAGTRGSRCRASLL
jgi:hypothetical protein